MRKAHLTAIALTLLGTLAFCAHALAAAGRTPGSFAVSQTGAATYAIPIWAPPGVRGLQPQIALVYNSRGGPGVMGTGWNIAGLSSISRCNRTYAQDQTPAAVTLTYSDAFCLDGTRLRLTSSEALSTYGQDGTTYQTEVADFSNITAHGTTGNGPSSFTVQAKNGLTYEYGVGGNSPVMDGATVLMWMLDKVTDRAGNAMVIAYVGPGSTLSGTTLPASISWAPTTHAGGTYSYTMNFVYNGANTPASSIFGFVAGNPVVNQDLLLNINILNSSSATVKNYVLGYDTNTTTTGATRLTSVRECADSGASNCLQSTTMTYQPGGAGIAISGSTLSGSISGATGLYDFDGDGYRDLAYQIGTTWYIAFGSASGYGTVLNSGISGPLGRSVLFGDVLGSGRDGILVGVTNGNWQYYSCSRTACSSGGSAGIPYVTNTIAALADVNGDGLPDLVTLVAVNASTLNVLTQANTSSGGTASFSTSTSTAYTLNASTTITDARFFTSDMYGGLVRRIDFNGDGREDVVVGVTACTAFQGQTACGVGAYQLIAQSNGTFSPTQLYNQNNTQTYIPVIAVNWNDDGCTDYATSAGVHISPCNGALPQNLSPSGGNVVAVMDWDGDGRADLIIRPFAGSTYTVQLSTGSGLATTTTSTTIPTSCTPAIVDADGDGLDDFGCLNSSGITVYLHNAAGTRPDVLASVSDGLGNSTNASYTSIVRGSYTNASDAAAGYKNYVGPLYVVSQATFSDPSSSSGATYNQQFSYFGAWTSLQGRGFMGFSQMRSQDSRTGLYADQYFARDFPNAGMTVEQDLSNSSFQISHAVGTPALASANTLDSTAFNQRFFPFISNWTTAVKEVGGTENGLLITTTSTDYTYHAQYGNAANVTVTVTDNDPNSVSPGQWTTTTATTFTEDASSNWCLGLPTAMVVTKTSPGSSIPRTVTFPNSDGANCRHTSKVTEPSTAYTLTESYGYNDLFGNLTDVTVSGVGVASRTTHTDWGPSGQLPKAVTNALSQTTQYTYDFNFGFRTGVQDPNGISVTWGDDAFGRKLSESRPDGTSTQWTYTDCASTGGCLIGSHGLIVTETVYNTNATVQTDGQAYFDSIDRSLVSTKRMLSGAYDRNEVRYDNLGRVVNRMMPCTWSGLTVACPYKVTNGYDVLNRVIQIDRPISEQNGTTQSTSIQYAGREISTTDPQGKLTTQYLTVAGTMARTKDHDNYYQHLTYDAFNSLVSVTDSLSNPLFSASYAYGVRAFQTDATDKDLDVSTASGQHRHYTYDALGELTSGSDAKGSNFSETYDLLSRPLVRTEPDLVTTWTWGNTAGGDNIGKLASVSANAYSESFSYDPQGRLAERAVTIPSDLTYKYDWTYNPTTGLLDTLTYPESTATYRLKLQYGYQNGIMQSVADFNAGTTVYWQANTSNSRGQITQEILGNNVVTHRAFDAVTGWMSSTTSGIGTAVDLQNDSYLYDEVGNLTLRQNNNAGLNENFFYDDLYRLDHSTLGANVNLQMHYDATGNITSRSDLAGGATWTYDANRKHAVTQAGNVAYSYSYDNNGNVLTRNGYNVTWTSYNHPLEIDSAGESVNFQYKDDHTRWSAVYSGSTGMETTYFIGDLLEKVTTVGPVYDYRHFIYAGGTKVAIYSRTSAGTNTLHYVREDHLGGVSGILNSDGTSDVKESFTAFGARRNTCTWTGPPTSGNLQAINAVTRHGFTWQTALGSMGLNDMNGRIQDVVTGRFLSPDPTVPHPEFTQSFNRYSYANNNPLTFTDPTGFDDEGQKGGCLGAQYDPSGCPYNTRDYINRQDAGWSTLPPAYAPPTRVYGGGLTTEEEPTDYPPTALPLQSADANRVNEPAPQAQESPPSAASVGVLAGASDIVGDFLAAVASQIVAAAAAGSLVLAPSATATQDDDSGRVFYHGTSTFSGGPLDAGAATANSNNYGSLPGFYLATDPATAVHFAAAAGQDPAVLQYYVNNTALKGLQQAGAVLGPVPGGPTSTMAFPGQQLYVPVTAFPTFNGYLVSGRIILMGIARP